MTRTLAVTGFIFLAALLYVQFVGVALQPTETVVKRADMPASPDGAAHDRTWVAIEELAAWPIAAAR